MKSKITINVKKLISIFLCSILVSSNLSNLTVFAGHNNTYYISSFEELEHTINNIVKNGDTILLNSDITIPDNSCCLNLNKDITIGSNNNATYKIQHENSNLEFLDICDGCTVTLEKIEIDFCFKEYVNTDPQIAPIKIRNNSTLNITSETTIKNFCSDNSLIKSDNSQVNLNDSQICHCHTKSRNGIICLTNNSKLQINEGYIEHCNAINGGAIFLSESEVIQSGGTISNCSATNGGAILAINNSKVLMCNNPQINGCSAQTYDGYPSAITIGGGAIFLSNSEVIQSGGTISNCSATNGGAILAIDNSKVSMRNNALISNCLTYNHENPSNSSNTVGGGAIYINNSGSAIIDASTISNCTSNKDGGAIMAAESACIILDTSTISNCSADRNGGAICNNDSTKLTINNNNEISECYSSNSDGTGKGNAIYIAHNAQIKFLNSDLCKIDISNRAQGQDNGQEMYGYSGIYDGNINNAENLLRSIIPRNYNLMADNETNVDENEANVDENETNVDENETNVDENNTNVDENNANVDENETNIILRGGTGKATDNEVNIDNEEYNIYHLDADGNIIIEQLQPEIEDNFIIRVFNENNNHEKLTEKTDYEVNFENKTMIINASYAKNLQKNTEIEFKLRLCPNTKYVDKNIKEAIESEAYDSNEDLWYTLTIDTSKLYQETQQDDLTFNNLKSEYTYGDNLRIIYVNSDSGSGYGAETAYLYAPFRNGNVTWSSSNTDVAEINEDTGEVTIKGVGQFQIIATIAADENYEELVVKSSIITINPRPVTIKNIKIKDKVFDNTNKAEFDGTPILDGVLDKDKANVTLINGTPTFSDKNIGKNIPINFTEFSLEGNGAGNYDIIQPTNIYGNIISEYSYKKDEESNLPPDSNDVTSTDISNLNDAKNNDSNNKPITANYKLNNIERNNLSKFPIDINSSFSNFENNNSEDLEDSENSTQYDSDETITNDDPDEIFEAEDDLTGIQVYTPKGVFPKWCRLVVREMYPNTNEYDATYKNLDEDIKNKIENIKLYEIHVVNQDGEVVQPNISKGLITVRIPVPNDYDLADLQIYRIKQDADDDFNETIVNINNKNYCEFQTNHFSPYTMIDEKSINDIIQSLIPYLLLCLILILISLFIMVLVKRKENRNTIQE